MQLPEAEEPKLDPQKLQLGGKNNIRLGSGGFADVFLGNYSEQEVAVKCLRTSLHPPGSTAWRMFIREAAIMAKLNHRQAWGQSEILGGACIARICQLHNPSPRACPDATSTGALFNATG